MSGVYYDHCYWRVPQMREIATAFASAGEFWESRLKFRISIGTRANSAAKLMRAIKFVRSQSLVWKAGPGRRSGE